MKPVRIGVLGAGLIGRKHIEVLRSGSDDYMLAGAADPSPAAKQEAETLGYACYATIEELLDKGKPDGVIIAVPNQMHVSAGLACIARKVPIIIEKPVETVRYVDVETVRNVGPDQATPLIEPEKGPAASK